MVQAKSAREVDGVDADGLSEAAQTRLVLKGGVEDFYRPAEPARRITLPRLRRLARGDPYQLERKPLYH